MANNQVSPDLLKGKTSAEGNVDYTPKQHSLRDQIVFSIKLIVIGAGIFLALWLLEL